MPTAHKRAHTSRFFYCFLSNSQQVYLTPPVSSPIEARHSTLFARFQQPELLALGQQQVSKALETARKHAHGEQLKAKLPGLRFSLYAHGRTGEIAVITVLVYSEIDLITVLSFIKFFKNLLTILSFCVIIYWETSFFLFLYT